MLFCDRRERVAAEKAETDLLTFSKLRAGRRAAKIRSGSDHRSAFEDGHHPGAVLRPPSPLG